MKIIKYLCLIILITVCSKTINAQLNNTSWKGEFKVPQPADCMMVFRGDTAYLVLGSEFNEQSILEVSNYKVAHDTLSIQKIAGSSPCSPDIIGQYSFIIKNDLLYIEVLNDDCSPRAAAFPTEALTLIKNKE